MDKLLTKFKNARVVIMGYYEFITEQSEEEYIHTMLKAFGKLPAGVLADAALELAEGLIKKRLLANCDTFAQESLVAFQEIAELLNNRYGSQRVIIASMDIKPENAQKCCFVKRHRQDTPTPKGPKPMPKPFSSYFEGTQT